jgi:hypothetical protein
VNEPHPTTAPDTGENAGAARLAVFVALDCFLGSNGRKKETPRRNKKRLWRETVNSESECAISFGRCSLRHFGENPVFQIV